VFGAIPKIVISLVGGFAVFVAWRVIRRLFWKDMPLPPRSSIPSRDKMQKM
jgi:hypothetical protein